MLGDGDHFRLIGMKQVGELKLADGVLRFGGIPDNEDETRKELSEFASRKFNMYLNDIGKLYGEELINEDFEAIGDPACLENPPYDFEIWTQENDFGVVEYVFHNHPADGVGFCRPDLCLPSSMSDEEVVEYVGDAGGELTLNVDCLDDENKKLYEKIVKYWDWVMEKMNRE